MPTPIAAPLCADLDELHAALADAGLPVSDLHEADRLFFRFDDDAGAIGFAGIEGDGGDRLLRSVVIVRGRRGHGLGSALTTALEAVAEGMGVEALHLLTTDAAPFFARQGYDARDRSAAPESIRASREFTSLCPASATYMSKSISV